MSSINDGLRAWQQSSNHNRMIALQRDPPSFGGEGPVELAYFGASAFRITSPAGITVMIDPWRNHPSGKWDWYRCDFPEIAVDIGISTHAHFDHDALTRLDAHVLLDRPIGTYQLGDVRITCIADKHVNDTPEGSLYPWPEYYRELSGVETRPPNNPRQFDNTIVVVETGGLRILHWGDNRHDPEPHVWEQIGKVDVAILPIDASIHLLTYAEADQISQRLGARAIVPCHYFVSAFVQRASTLLPATAYVAARDHVATGAATFTLIKAGLVGWSSKVLFFGDHVAFDPPGKPPGQDYG